MNANMLIRFFTIALPLCVLISCGSNQEKKESRQALPAVSNIENTPVGETREPEEIPPAREDEEAEPDLENLPFAELVRRVPITPLPIGVEGLDSMFTYGPLGDPLLFFDYDSLNMYGLNDYFFNHPELDEGDAGMPWVRGSPPHYFSKRLPPLDNKEVLLFYNEEFARDTTYTWYIFVCEQDGEIFTSTPIMGSGSWGITLGHIDEKYILKEYLYNNPYKLGDLPKYREKNIGDEVHDSIIENNLTVLHKMQLYSVIKRNSEPISVGLRSRRYYWKQGLPVVYDEIIDGKLIEYPILIEGEEEKKDDVE